MRRAFTFLLALALCLFMIPSPARADESSLPEAEESQPAPTVEPSPEPSAAPTPFLNPTPPPPVSEPSSSPEQTRLYIDNKNVYAQMERSYSQGYVPMVSQGSAVLVLPLLCEGELLDGSLRAKVDLGDVSGPFVIRNYERTIELAENPVDGGKRKVRSYCVSFPLQLRPERFNGSYPVTVSISARDSQGMAVQEAFTVYVTVTDGKDPNATPAPEPVQPDPTPEPAPLGPKVIVQSCQAVSLEEGREPGDIHAGDRLRVKITLLNTSKTEALENMLVTAAAPQEGFLLTTPSDSLYLESLGAGQTADMTLEYTVKPEIPAGQYTIGLTYDFAYHNGLTGAGAGSARVNIRQPLKMEFSLGQMPQEAVISDTIEVNVQAINLSHAKAYNVRAVMEGDGLVPGGTALIGDVEGGASGEKPLRVGITGLTKSEMSYGQTTGTVTYLYQDEEGVEHSETASFVVNIKSPFSQEKKEEADQPNQWWAIMAGILLVLLAFGGVFAVRAIRRRRA